MAHNTIKDYMSIPDWPYEDTIASDTRWLDINHQYQNIQSYFKKIENNTAQIINLKPDLNEYEADIYVNSESKMNAIKVFLDTIKIRLDNLAKARQKIKFPEMKISPFLAHDQTKYGDYFIFRKNFIDVYTKENFTDIQLYFLLNQFLGEKPKKLLQSVSLLQSYSEAIKTLDEIYYKTDLIIHENIKLLKNLSVCLDKPNDIQYLLHKQQACITCLRDLIKSSNQNSPSVETSVLHDILVSKLSKQTLEHYEKFKEQFKQHETQNTEMIKIKRSILRLEGKSMADIDLIHPIVDQIDNEVDIYFKFLIQYIHQMSTVNSLSVKQEKVFSHATFSQQKVVPHASKQRTNHANHSKVAPKTGSSNNNYVKCCIFCMPNNISVKFAIIQNKRQITLNRQVRQDHNSYQCENKINTFSVPERWNIVKKFHACPLCLKVTFQGCNSKNLHECSYLKLHPNFQCKNCKGRHNNKLCLA